MIAIIGAGGNVGRQAIDHAIARGFPPHRIRAYDVRHSPELESFKRQGVMIARSLAELDGCLTIYPAVKQDTLIDILRDYPHPALVISPVAGLSWSTLKLIDHGHDYLRVMPSMINGPRDPTPYYRPPLHGICQTTAWEFLGPHCYPVTSDYELTHHTIFSCTPAHLSRLAEAVIAGYQSSLHSEITRREVLKIWRAVGQQLETTSGAKICDQVATKAGMTYTAGLRWKADGCSERITEDFTQIHRDSLKWALDVETRIIEKLD